MNKETLQAEILRRLQDHYKTLMLPCIVEELKRDREEIKAKCAPLAEAIEEAASNCTRAKEKLDAVIEKESARIKKVTEHLTECLDETKQKIEFQKQKVKDLRKKSKRPLSESLVDFTCDLENAERDLKTNKTFIRDFDSSVAEAQEVVRREYVDEKRNVATELSGLEFQLSELKRKEAVLRASILEDDVLIRKASSIAESRLDQTEIAKDADKLTSCLALPILEWIIKTIGLASVLARCDEGVRCDSEVRCDCDEGSVLEPQAKPHN